jgi:hypothetical protein
VRSDSAPLWSYGPTKTLYAESWLDSIALATGVGLGGCDFRFSDLSPLAHSDQIQIRFAFATSPGIDPGFYAATAQNLGGCPVAAAHAQPSGLVSAVTRRMALARLCPGSFVPGPDATSEALVRSAYHGFGRPPTDDEISIWLSHLKDGGSDLQALADQLCASLYATAQFNYY